MLTALFPRAHARYPSLPLLGPVLERLCRWFHSKGYPHNAIRRRVPGAPLLERWLHRSHIRSLQDCTASQLNACVPEPRRWTAHMAHALARSLAQYLAERGELACAPSSPASQLIASYRTFLEQVRGLAPATVNRSAMISADFLHSLAYDQHPQRLGQLDVAQIDAFVTRAAQRLGGASMQKVSAVLRSFLKFLATAGKIPAGLEQHIESPRQYRGERLPRALHWGDVLKLLRSVDRSTSKGRRDYAMLLLIATYGLRVGEVARLELDDIAWRSQHISIPRPKVGTPLLLPLTDEIAAALLDYLRRDRPDSVHRRVFLRVREPVAPIASTAICDAFDAWVARAGIRLPRLGGTHCLRHALAMHLLREQTPITTIGDLLGHRNVESTGIYLRLDVEDLRDVALPLPSALEPEVQP
jgi:integrase/recombinase XerD